MSTPSLLRLEEYRALSGIALSGRVLDLGGEKGAEYLARFTGDFDVTTLNVSAKARPDIFHDLEKPLPIANEAYDHVLLINVLEHIFNYRELLREAARVLKPGGTLVVVVPFLFPFHPSPGDFRRFTETALNEELTLSGFMVKKIETLGTGVWSARYTALDRLLPSPLRAVRFHTLRYGALLLDHLTAALARVLGKKYRASDYALGFCAVATKP